MKFWNPSTLPGCFGHPCEVLQLWKTGPLAYVWQASHITARGVWCWRIGRGEIHTVADGGNRGVAKMAAYRALRALLREHREALPVS